MLWRYHQGSLLNAVKAHWVQWTSLVEEKGEMEAFVTTILFVSKSALERNTEAASYADPARQGRHHCLQGWRWGHYEDPLHFKTFKPQEREIMHMKYPVIRKVIIMAQLQMPSVDPSPAASLLATHQGWGSPSLTPTAGPSPSVAFQGALQSPCSTGRASHT